MATPGHHWWQAVSARGPPLPAHCTCPPPATEQNTGTQRVQATETNPQGASLSPLTASPASQGPQRNSGSSEQIPPATNLVKFPLTLMAQTVKSSCSAGDPGSIPGSGRYPGEKNDYPLQYSSCLGNPTDRGAWQATVHGVQSIESDPTEQPALLTFFTEPIRQQCL